MTSRRKVDSQQTKMDKSESNKSTDSSIYSVDSKIGSEIFHPPQQEFHFLEEFKCIPKSEYNDDFDQRSLRSRLSNTENINDLEWVLNEKIFNIKEKALTSSKVLSQKDESDTKFKICDKNKSKELIQNKPDKKTKNKSKQIQNNIATKEHSINEPPKKICRENSDLSIYSLDSNDSKSNKVVSISAYIPKDTKSALEQPQRSNDKNLHATTALSIDAAEGKNVVITITAKTSQTKPNSTKKSKSSRKLSPFRKSLVSLVSYIKSKSRSKENLRTKQKRSKSKKKQSRNASKRKLMKSQSSFVDKKSRSSKESILSKSSIKLGKKFKENKLSKSIQRHNEFNSDSKLNLNKISKIKTSNLNNSTYFITSGVNKNDFQSKIKSSNSTLIIDQMKRLSVQNNDKSKLSEDNLNILQRNESNLFNMNQRKLFSQTYSQNNYKTDNPNLVTTRTCISDDAVSNFENVIIEKENSNKSDCSTLSNEIDDQVQKVINKEEQIEKKFKPSWNSDDSLSVSQRHVKH
ncbi:hypothetical protein RDWZM_001158 [Blomia tropicalis]|uniref:Uncharacterized protein n=1 Tax=Blomia tropicalis TaxID=40697 RepID=A0A9Q0MCL1_BLOTA|nr:hypothetical protein RDWZM_001158 [Blomia tropicalis]